MLPQEQRSVKRIFTSLVALLVLQIQAGAQPLPKLVVCITVDQLRGDLLDELSPYMGSDGINRLLKGGLVYTKVKYPYMPNNAAAATASIFTGTNPEIHGITSPKAYDRTAKSIKDIFRDDNFVGNYTRDNLSPKPLMVNTLGDQLKVADKSCRVYSIAPDYGEAISAGGYAADGAFWIDDRIGSWASSNYYEKMPAYIDRYNRSAEGPNKRLSSVKWTPTGTDRFSSPYFSGKKITYSFNTNNVPDYKRSALVNKEISDLANLFIGNAGFETSNVPNLLTLNYYAGNYPKSVNGDYSPEIVDTYLKLDQSIASVLNQIDKKIGLRNCIVTFTGTGYYNPAKSSGTSAEKLKHSISLKRCKTLINLFLSASYGSGEWVSDCFDGNIFLNRKLIDQKRISLSDIQNKVCELLYDLDGVSGAYPSLLFNSGSALTRDVLKWKLGSHPKYRPDVYIRLAPGWIFEDSTLQESVESSGNSYQTFNAVQTPFIIYGLNIEPRVLEGKTVYAGDIAPTIASILRIRPPTATDRFSLDITSNKKK